MHKRDNRGATREPRVLTCSCGAFLGRLSPEDEESPAIFSAVVNGRYDGHTVRVLRRSEFRAAVGEQSAADALDTLAAHLAATAEQPAEQTV